MRLQRFTNAILISLVFCTNENYRSFAAGDGEANANVAATATLEEAAMRGVAYAARLAARAAADEGFALGHTGDFAAARKKFSEAIELDPGFSPAYRLRAAACFKMRDWAVAVVDLDILITLDPNDADIFNERGYARRQLGDLHGARSDFDRCIALGTTNLALAYANRAEVEMMLGDDDDAAADLARGRSLAPTMPHSPAVSLSPGTRKSQTNDDGRGTGTSNSAK